MTPRAQLAEWETAVAREERRGEESGCHADSSGDWPPLLLTPLKSSGKGGGVSRRRLPKSTQWPPLPKESATWQKKQRPKQQPGNDGNDPRGSGVVLHQGAVGVGDDSNMGISKAVMKPPHQRHHSSLVAMDRSKMLMLWVDDDRTSSDISSINDNNRNTANDQQQETTSSDNSGDL